MPIRHDLRPGRLWVPGLISLAVLVTAIYVRAPMGLGEMVRVGIIVVLATVLVIWPHLVGARPRWIWSLLSLACILIVVAHLVRPLAILVGDVRLTDLLFVGAYTAGIVWLIGMAASQIGTDRTLRVVIDSFAAGAGLVLALWVYAEAAGRDITATEALVLAYPLLDMLALAPALHLAFHVGARTPAWRFVAAGIAWLLFIDSTYFVAELQGVALTPFISMGYPFAYLLFGVAILHPSIRRPTRRSVPQRQARSSTRVVLVLVGVLLAVGSVISIGQAVPERTVHSVLIAVLLLLLFARLALTGRAQARAENVARRRALQDPLTGLPNRTAFVQHLDEMVDTAAEEERSTVVLRIDLDRFRSFNDARGHHAGDHLLRAVGARLSAATAPGHVLARHSGDEFIVVAGVADEYEALTLAERLFAQFSAPVQVTDMLLEPVSASIGVAVVAPGEFESGQDALMQRSDAALREAKGGDGIVLYDEELDARIRMRTVMAHSLKAAIANGTLSVAFQPIHGGPGYGRLLGWEALARWDDPVLGSVPPMSFIPLAEETGLICDLGDLILDRALAEFAALRDAHADPDLFCSVNVSAAQLQQGGLHTKVAQALAASGVPASSLRLEITETLMVGDGALQMNELQELRTLGAGLALDDFGTGYASFTTLRQLPLTCVKLDRSLICRLGAETAAPAQVKAILDLVSSLGIDTVVAEGVETEDQARTLHALGCPSVQGWRFGRPVTSRQILDSRERHARVVRTGATG
ncbi:MAG: EAL domain-containing protein [Mobilicoccus sp.]|nr:EAL domain-containing protein [Mobilicoccus sp.]